MSNPKLHQKPIFASGPLIPTFAKVPAEKGCECWNRTTGGGDLKFAPHLAPNSLANINSHTPPKTYICKWSFDSNIRKSACREGCKCWNRTTGGVDLTFAPHLAASSLANVKSQTPPETYIC